MNEVGYKPYTVADLISDLAGLPPMMEVYLEAEGTEMFLVGISIERETKSAPPHLIIVANRFPKRKGIDPTTYDEELAKMRQKAMHMAAVSEKETQMHRIVD